MAYQQCNGGVTAGDRMDRWAAEPFRMFLNGPMWEPPDEDQLKFTAEDVEKVCVPVCVSLRVPQLVPLCVYLGVSHTAPLCVAQCVSQGPLSLYVLVYPTLFLSLSGSGNIPVCLPMCISSSDLSAHLCPAVCVCTLLYCELRSSRFCVTVCVRVPVCLNCVAGAVL